MTQRPVVTRFAPSPTGFVHIGNARTCLFSWLYARHTGGKFLLRIEDTDKERSTQEAIDAIFEGLEWLGIDWDEEPVFQSARAGRHREVAEQLLASGNAYKCYATQDELTEMREAARATGKPPRYDGRWRDREPGAAQGNQPYVIRLRAEQTGETVVRDHVQGDVTFRNDHLDDLILLRSDGSPTYMLAVVVDDHDMGVTHVVRGDDHLNNAARQMQIIKGLGWDAPDYAHVPLLHGPDGAKFSKRHGAQGVREYRDLGYLPDAMRNYLLRLGWSYGDHEIISQADAIKWFDLDGINKAAARFDFDKLNHVNAHYIRKRNGEALLSEVLALAGPLHGWDLSEEHKGRLLRALPSLSERANTLLDIIEGADFLFAPRPIPIEDKADKLLTDESRPILAALADALEGDLVTDADWTLEAIEARIRAFAEVHELKFGHVAQPVRASCAGKMKSPGIFDVLYALGRAESLARMRDQVR